MTWATRILARYRSASDLPLMAKPNNGLPELVDMEVVYRQTPDEMLIGLNDVLAAGARIVGSCCGTTAQHIAASAPRSTRGLRSRSREAYSAATMSVQGAL